jgi:hypothetical protein
MLRPKMVFMVAMGFVLVVGTERAGASPDVDESGKSVATRQVVAAPLATGVPDLSGTWEGSLKGKQFDKAETNKPVKLKKTVSLTITQTGADAASVLNFTAGGDPGLPLTSGSTLISLGLTGSSGNGILNAFVDVFGSQTVCSGHAALSQKKLKARCLTATPEFSHEYTLRLKRQ